MRLDPVGRLLKLPPPLANRVHVTRAIPVRVRDGAILRADHYAPALDARLPTVLVRTPYGRGAPVSLLCRAVAQRGFHVLIQSCRGTGDSGGTFEPLLQEREDGLDTLDWLRRQPWYDGRLLTYGPSYVGFVQWALAAEAGDELKAMATIVTASDFGPPTYAGGAFSLDTVLTWSALLEAQRGPRLENAVELLRGQPRLQRGLARVPMAEADRITTGAEIEFFQRWLAEADPAAPYWTERGHTHRLPHVTAPVLMIGGWYDIFLPWQLSDYAALRKAGNQPYLTIGPWHHGSAGLFQHSAAESVAWFRAHTGGPERVRERPVRVHVGGADGWLEMADWPPPDSSPQRWYLSSGGRLDRSPGADGEHVDAFTYDPKDPTPAVGGPRLVGKISGRRDNRPLESRPDVLTFTSPPLAEPLDVIGPVAADVVVKATAPYFDVFVRLCEVDEQGRSWNVCDGLARVSEPDRPEGPVEVRVELWPTAHRFAAGRRIRVQVSGGAHPRFSRNPGTGAPLGHELELRAVRQELLAPSSITLPVPEA
ncbi:CocE/NonD family hydrolase [Dactylosporangium sp. AC04546]|uniref:CocE/NonD family hydrolase n=1 Tax=Dactylosporangium sp. AC04546 TaxID=2862460 RepID=UPI001EDED1A1|nr:CocE/NonD family hydrolase [Dactylosporangium sp. AC04546]WVK81760.1 CocE/NonD family hydrolase [Dactylosporangium sp. AC04546]